MAEEEHAVKPFRTGVKIQISAKGDVYGEYTFRGDDKEELEAMGKDTLDTFKKHIEDWKKEKQK